MELFGYRFPQALRRGTLKSQVPAESAGGFVEYF